MALFGFLKGGSKGDKKAFSVDKGRIFRYTHMPEILPRIRALGQKFGQFAFLLAMVYRSARLLPANHPMLNPNNIGKYGIADVIATAANGLVMKRDNMDQILIFGAVAMALIMIVVQAGLIAFYAFLSSASAADGSMFTTPSPGTDVMTQFLSQVFGFKQIFASPQAMDQPGLYAILGLYSTAMMIIAVMIVIYYVITVVGESAQSGQPFGRRFNGLWAPVRLVLALGLLVPLGGGINAAQFMTLHIAKFGSGLATKGWIAFTEKLTDPDSMKGNIRAPSAQPLAAAIFQNEVCRAAYNLVHKGASQQVRIYAYNGLTSQKATFSGADILFARRSNTRTLKYVWAADSAITMNLATVAKCGQIDMPILSTDVTSGGSSIARNIMQTMQSQYAEAMGQMVRAISGQIENVISGSASDKLAKKTFAVAGVSYAAASAVTDDDIAKELARAMDEAQETINNAVKNVDWDPDGDSVISRMKKDATERGWGTAGVYYLEIAKMAQLILDSVGGSYPAFATPPDGTTSFFNQGKLAWLGEKLGITDSDKQVRQAIDKTPGIIQLANGLAQKLPTGLAATPEKEKFANRGGMGDPIAWAASWLFGDAFMTLIDKPELNPMGRLIQGGSYILERTKTMIYLYAFFQVGGVVGSVIAGAMAGAAAGTLTATPIGILGGAAGGALAMGIAAQVFQALAGLIWFFLLLGLAVGIVLFYLLPLLPFMYFFFSAVNWVIEVAEAFVSMPLFALSHLRIEGDGLPGQTAMQGWMILFGVLLRPLMIVVGMIVGSLVFNAGAYYLNTIYKYAIFAYNPQVTSVADGLDFSQISGFGLVTYLVLYTYLIYMLANSSFKLIDTIPDKMMRWIGGPQPFTGDRPVELGSMQNMALAGYAAMSQGAGAIKGIGEHGGAISKMLAERRRPPGDGGGAGG